jgi:shikimate kinase
MADTPPPLPFPPHVALLGMMGSGKTTVGTRLAERLGRPYLDNDERFVARFGETPAQVAGTRGADALHAMEVELLRDALTSPTPSVIAVPGGVVLEPSARALLQPTFRVWLDARPESLARRIPRDDYRPFLSGDMTQALRALDAERRPHFASLAQLVLPTDAPGFTPDAAVERILEALPGARAT